MRLKRIELAGFKSFVDPTRIELDQGITAIVGPNGCGKSNIVDALRWVLGEHSARHLRGGVMDDLIFQGSDSRAPVAICDVELTFNIEKGSLSTPYHDTDEIRVRRRLTRDGNSDAFINGKMVRIKDIVDLFLDTGISTRAYAIVEQGSIARMVTAKPEERRVIFEEAAGVMKYRSRRREAERRMKETRQNLDRVLDLLEEVRSQCRSLKQQASRAERFKTLQYEFSRLQSLSLALRYRALQEHYQQIETALVSANSEENSSAQQLTACEKSVAEARDRLVAHEHEAQAVQDALRSAEQQRSDLQQQAERASGQRRLLTERKEALQLRLQESTNQQQAIASERDDIEQQIAKQNDAELLAQQRSAAAVVEASTIRYRSQSNRRDRLLAEFERLRLANEQAVQQRNNAEQALSRLQQREIQLSARQSALSDQLNMQEGHAQASAQQQTSAHQQQQDAELALHEAQNELECCRQAREASAQLYHSQESELYACNGVMQELRERCKSQDVSDDLRSAFREKGCLWMDEVLHVPEGLEAAVAAALRGRSADVCLSSNTSTTDLQQLLKQASAEPVALFQCQHASTSTTDSQSTSLATAIGIDVSHPLYALFAPIQLVEKIEDAIIGKSATNACCVSRDGWRREAGGWLIPPSGNRTARRLAAQRSLRASERKVSQVEITLKQHKQQFESAEKALQQMQERWQQAHLQSTQAQSQVQNADAGVLRAKAELSSLQEQQQRLKADVAEQEKEHQYWQEQLTQATDINRLSALQQQAKDVLSQQQEAMSQADETLNHARQCKAQADQALALFTQACDSLSQQCERLSQEEARLTSRMETDHTRLQQVEAELKQAHNRSDLDQQLARSISAVDAAHQRLNAVRSTGHALQQLLHESERSERQAQQVLQLTATQRQNIEVEQAKYAARLEDTDSEIRQRFQTSAQQLLHDLEHTDENDDASGTAEMEQCKNADVIMQRVNTLEEQIHRFGPVNLLAIDEFEQASQREGFLSTQVSDLEDSLTTLENTIASIDRTTKERFKDLFEQTNANFKQTFPQLFGGGRAELKLDSDDILTAGVEVIAQPPGKRLQAVGLLSGGEKALTAVALVFSIFKIKPAPFCVLDEVDAPLDDANVGRFGDMVRELSDRVQFLSISHNKISMQKADRLIGISMPEPGVSKIISVDLKQLPPNT
ncbi:chromosome segregation protein SMC [Mariprofundus sp. EBB-1]|uniref:chromosome segregation protein SMC n=1 Tax=Mariprofundus sp. EBB-1 TaxID=2650971 RepID=UPI000EF27E19|nr:chromosome segregation protein SMC [Mariprofundus sp. EBB-1]RLL54784.1 chromosome segregation protein SMC [Mariprofundus sp. EBB-1]